MTDHPDLEQIKTELRQLISELAEIPLEKVKDDTRFNEDLGINSMLALEIVNAIEKKYRIMMPEQEIPKIRSLNDVYEILGRFLK